MKTIFVVEDEHDIASVLVDYLRAAGFEPRHFADGEAALQAALTAPPALLLLDLMLPGRSGLEVLREIRQRSGVPVVMLTARVDEVDRLLGLELGADDYICKPFSPREVVARVKAVLRRMGDEGAAPPSRLQVEEASRSALLDGHRLHLTPKEFALLATMSARPGRIYSRAQLLELVYPDALEANERTLDSHIKNLRRKLATAVPGHDWIRSVYGVGFSFEPH
ncbi:response regulator [Ramlibacter sp.]|uniref:response regulator n=1 Tax=Ramlibacter sp. TaxID=1917967 RepID=UPI002636372D|nr:response regulator [Ramlibacter sp.]MDB5954678.1 two component transcriptional regulator, winged helix family [Ramlibacter sp.]